jgi:hypothetical protein
MGTTQKNLKLQLESQLEASMPMLSSANLYSEDGEVVLSILPVCVGLVGGLGERVEPAKLYSVVEVRVA